MRSLPTIPPSAHPGLMQARGMAAAAPVLRNTERQAWSLAVRDAIDPAGAAGNFTGESHGNR